ncbi:MBL fold metallo-hydrolase [Plastorhodobacter daqingensis]|jgi:glyoxylase-like metal-dependent hydrolase (beta-lactamase superfamily II)|uniref:MBL fold metallo-hydrolase n=1 Tax=Plastorhodobacter daqingensis TaxID=1387281 RepID=A0ABW2UPH3_9RHOB
MSRLNRRTLLTGAALLPVVSAVAGGARPAMADGHGMAPGQGTTPGAALYTAPLGSFRITALLDGMAPLGRGFFFGGAEVDQVLAAAGIGPDAVPAPVSAFLIQSADRTILIDAGMGQQETLGPGFGRLTAGLAAAGVAPEDVDMVVVTHAHPDHVGGLIRDGAPVFANAELAIGEVEAAFWTDAAIMAQAPAEAQPTFQFAQTVLAAYGDRITRIVDGAEAAPGLTMMLSPGHTPGHCVVRIDGGDRQLLMIADTLHSADVHTALPDVGFGFDSDPAQAAASRRRIFDMVAADKMLVAGSHIHFPGFGRILAEGPAYRYRPATWM